MSDLPTIQIGVKINSDNNVLGIGVIDHKATIMTHNDLVSVRKQIGDFMGDPTGSDQTAIYWKFTKPLEYRSKEITELHQLLLSKIHQKLAIIEEISPVEFEGRVYQLMNAAGPTLDVTKVLAQPKKSVPKLTESDEKSRWSRTNRAIPTEPNKGEYRNGFTQIANTVLLNTHLNPKTRLLYCILSSYPRETGTSDIVFPSQETLMSLLEVKERMIRYHLATLEDFNLIKIIHTGNHRTNRYQLLVAPK